jgi:carbon-monoxide dehydrogenase medium subunit
MYPADIQEYARPHTIDEVFEIITRYDEGESLLVAGGQSVMQVIKSRMLKPQCVIDLQNIKELQTVDDGSDVLTIGAMVRYCTLARSKYLDRIFSGLKDAASHVGDRQVRNRGTIGGSVCWNYPAACTPATVLALNGEMHLLSSTGEAKTIRADDFFLGPLETAKAESDVLISISFNKPGQNSGSAYKKWGLVKDALPVVGISAFIILDQEGFCCEARVGLTGMGLGAKRATEGEKELLSSNGDANAISAAIDAICEAVDPPSDLSATTAYRYQLLRSLGADVIESAFKRAANYSLGS